MREHGTRACYVHGPLPGSGKGCRCAPCSAANAAAVRRLARQIEPPYVDAEPARDHLAALSTQGVGWKRAAIAAGLQPSTVWKLLYGDPGRGRGPSKRIRRATLEAILSVTTDAAAPGSRLPAGPTWDAIDRLVAAGVPKARIAERLGQRGPGLQVGRDYVTRRHHDAVAAMVAELDAGTLITVRRSRHGDTVVAPPAAPRRPGPILPTFPILDLPDWLQQAACKGRPPWMWFPEPGDTKTTGAALKVCGACSVRAQCLADHQDDDDGIYGGTTPADRAARREQAA